ncbi:MAG: DUF4159 domain-containing protein [Hyphomicrobiales bacterium]|nr:DUF4159 domain-containing protein [Hyphomicrobiales bacterium]
MSALLALGFGAPAALLALLALPALVWLLRVAPPRPQVVDFPPTALMRDLVAREETPARTPWWLLALRLAAVAALAIALARPVLDPSVADDGASGPLWLIVDDGWPAAPRWAETAAAIAARLDAAEARGRPVVLLGAASGPAQPVEARSVDEARRRLAVWAPAAWEERRDDLLAPLAREADARPPGSVVWIAHGADLATEPATRAFLERLREAARNAPLTVSLPPRVDTVAVDRLDNGAAATAAGLVRADPREADAVRLAALDAKGRRLAETEVAFAPGAARAEARFDLPLEFRNDVGRVEIVDRRSAGGVRLADERWRRRAVGVIAGGGFDRDQPLLAPTHYLDAALAPFADRRRPRATETDAAIRELLDGGVSALILADVGRLPKATAALLLAWVEKGGVLVRFAGPHLAAAASDDPLLPVRLRQGERSLGGALSWSSPRGLGPFAETGPFADLAAPAEVRVSRQILAEPGPDLAERAWANLDDGTPLVTAAQRGRGRVVLFHVGADTVWSDLPLSGVFPEMLRRIVALAGLPSNAATPPAGAAHAALPPWRLLDGLGRLGSPSAEARPIAVADFAATRPDRAHPPGLWGRGDAFLALQPIETGRDLARLEDRLDGATIVRRDGAARRPLAAGFLVAAICLLLLDGIVLLAPALRPRRRVAAVAIFAAVALAGLAAPPPARAANAPIDARARDAALAPRLAYVATGDASLDDVTRRGLAALTRALADRTSFEPADPVAVDPGVDDLAVYPLIYWSVSPDAAPVSPKALAHVDAFMRGGGTVIFDTRDADEAAALRGTGRATPTGAALRRLVAGLDLPELAPTPNDHVLGRTFYLLQAFPGRFEGPVWIAAGDAPGAEATADRPLRAADGVSSILITGNDFVGAWARTDDDDDLLPMASADPRGREMALRVGVNVVMYVLTGNYKADQVHLPALLKRLGR